MGYEILRYLEEVRSHLHLDPATELRTIRELHSYFEEKISELLEEGLSQEEATRVAIRSCGRPRVIALRMYEAYSQGNWIEAVLAFLPHFILAGLFWFHLWSQPLFMVAVFGFILAITLYGWWYGKPGWVYPWVSYSLLGLVIGGYILEGAVTQAVTSLISGQEQFNSIMVLLVALVLLVPCVWILVRISTSVVRRDWILASLMLVTVPVAVGWLWNMERFGGLFSGSAEGLHSLDVAMSLALSTLGVTSATFIRLRQRVLKVGALVVIGSIALSTVVHNIWGDKGLLSTLVASLLMFLVVLSPALLEARIGHGIKGEAWWESAGFERSSTKGYF